MKKILGFTLLCFFLLAVEGMIYASTGRIWVGSLNSGVWTSNSSSKPDSLRDDVIKIGKSIPGVISLQFSKQKKRVHIYVQCREKGECPAIVKELRKRFKKKLGLVLDTKNKPDS